jgi:hypothetical protein
MNLEGGVGRDFLKRRSHCRARLLRVVQADRRVIDGIPGIIIRGKNRVFTLGPEVSLALVRNGVLFGFLKLNYEWETYAGRRLRAVSSTSP